MTRRLKRIGLTVGKLVLQSTFGVALLEAFLGFLIIVNGSLKYLI